MEVASRTLLIVLFFLWVVPVVLEVFLARTRSPIPGLVLPVLSFLLSLIPVLSVAAYGGICQVIGTMVMTLLIGNIMTLILLAIFFAVRHSRKKKSEMEKMNIQDLYGHRGAKKNGVCHSRKGKEAGAVVAFLFYCSSPMTSSTGREITMPCAGVFSPQEVVMADMISHFFSRGTTIITNSCSSCSEMPKYWLACSEFLRRPFITVPPRAPAARATSTTSSL